eukprot:767077-Hanusia_phi.AAC.2
MAASRCWDSRGEGGEDRRRRLPSPQLVEGAETEVVRVEDDDGVGGVNVETRLDDGRGYEDVCSSLAELDQSLVQVLELSMRHQHPRSRQKPRDSRDHVLDVGYTRDNAEGLAGAIHLELEGLEEERLRQLAHARLDLLLRARRSLHDGHVPEAAHGHVQRAGDGGGGEGQDVDADTQSLELLLVVDPEPLLLVHHDQPQPPEADLRRQNRMRPDKDVDVPGSDLQQQLPPRLGRQKASEESCPHAEALEASLEGPEVLHREDGGGSQENCLTLLSDAEEESAHCNLGLTEADVPADEPVHGDVSLAQVELDVSECLHLISRRLVGKRLLEVCLALR